MRLLTLVVAFAIMITLVGSTDAQVKGKKGLPPPPAPPELTPQEKSVQPFVKAIKDWTQEDLIDNSKMGFTRRKLSISDAKLTVAESNFDAKPYSATITWMVDIQNTKIYESADDAKAAAFTSAPHPISKIDPLYGDARIMGSLHQTKDGKWHVDTVDWRDKIGRYHTISEKSKERSTFWDALKAVEK